MYIKLKTDTLENLTEKNEILQLGEMCYIKDLDGHITACKAGNGKDHFNDLPMFYDMNKTERYTAACDDIYYILNSDVYPALKRLKRGFKKQVFINKLLTIIVTINTLYWCIDAIIKLWS